MLVKDLTPGVKIKFSESGLFRQVVSLRDVSPDYVIIELLIGDKTVYRRLRNSDLVIEINEKYK